MKRQILLLSVSAVSMGQSDILILNYSTAQTLTVCVSGESILVYRAQRRESSEWVLAMLAPAIGVANGTNPNKPAAEIF